MSSVTGRAVKVLLSLLLLVPPLVFAQSASELASQIRQLSLQLGSLQRRSLSRRMDTSADTDAVTTAQTRLALLKRLAALDPAAAHAAMYTAEESTALIEANPDLAGVIETASEWTGALEQTIADDFANHQSHTHWILHTPDDRRIELLFDQAPTRAALLNQTVSVAGMGVDNLVSVHSMTEAPAPTQTTTPTCTTIGTQNTAVLVMNQFSSPAYPAGLDQFSYWSPQYFNSSPKSVNSFWQETSFGLTSNTGSLYGPFTLDQNYGCSDTDSLATSAITIAKAKGVDFSQVTRVSIIFPETSCNFGGLGNIGCRTPDNLISHPYSVTWIPVLNYYTTSLQLWGLLAHEQGHNLGLAHSNSLDFGTLTLGAIDYTDSSVASSSTAINTEYGDPYTIMGGGAYSCQGQYTAFNKNQYLSWLGSASVTEVTSSGNFTLVPYELSSGVRGLRVLRDAITGSWLWLEYRQSIGSYDPALGTCRSDSNVLQGALGYYESLNSSDGHLFLLDFTPTSAPNNFSDAALLPGHSWSDPYSPLTLTVNSADANGLSLSASYDQPCATPALSASVFSALTGTGTVTVTAPGNCSWQASSAATWITFTGTTSGTGNGIIPFTVAANASHNQRNSYITVQRQSLPVAQKGTGTFISSLNPALQFGTSGTINFTLEDPLGTTDIKNLQIYFQDYTLCEVYVAQASGKISFRIYDNSTATFTSTIAAGQNATISNAYCSLSGVGTTVTRAGNQLQLALNMGFTSAFMGSHRVTAVVTDSTGGSVETSIGTWQVVPAASISNVTPNSGQQGYSVPIVITGLNTHFSNSSTVTISGTGVASSAISASSGTQLNATLTIDSSAALGARTLTVTTGTEVVTSTFTINGIGQASLAPTSLTFATQTVGTTSDSQTIVLTNVGNATLNISSIAVTSEFGVTHNCGTSLAAGAQCNLNVTFQPLYYETRPGVLTVTDDGVGSPHTATLAGYGQLSFTPTRPDRPTRSVASAASAPAPVVITNTVATIPLAVPSAATTTAATSAAAPPPAATAPVSTTISNAPRLTCAAPRQLACSIERTIDSSSHVFYNLHLDAARAPARTYIVVLTLVDDDQKEKLEVPVKVTRKKSDHAASTE